MSKSPTLIRFPGVLSTIILALMLAATPLAADQVTGSVNGEALQWHVLEADDGKTVNFREDFPGFYSITIQAHREARYAVEGSISITFSLMGDDVLDATAMYFGESRMTPHFVDESAIDGLVLERVALEGDEPRIVGRYEGVLNHRSSMFGEPDPTNTVSLLVEFDVTPTREN